MNLRRSNYKKNAYICTTMLSKFGHMYFLIIQEFHLVYICEVVVQRVGMPSRVFMSIAISDYCLLATGWGWDFKRRNTTNSLESRSIFPIRWITNGTLM